MSKEAKLSELCFDIETVFGRAKSLYDGIKAGLVTTQQEMKEWLKKQTTKQRSDYKQYTSFLFLMLGLFLQLI